MAMMSSTHTPIMMWLPLTPCRTYMQSSCIIGTECEWADKVYDTVMLNKTFGDASSNKEIEESCPHMELNKYALGSSVIEYMSIEPGHRADLC